MKKQKTGILFFLTIISLLIIGGVVFVNFIKKPKINTIENPAASSVLGESISSDNRELPFTGINNIVKETVNNTQSAVSEKIVEVQKSAIRTIEKEVSNLAQSQIDAFKLQLCRDWGIVKETPTPIP